MDIGRIGRLLSDRRKEDRNVESTFAARVPSRPLGIFVSIEIVMSNYSGPVEEIGMKRLLWLLAAGSMSTVLLHPQEASAPSEVPSAAETAKAASETASDKPDKVDEPPSAEVAPVPTESPSTSRSVEAEDVAPSAAPAPVRSEEASVKPADQPPYDPTDNVQWESRYVGDRVPAASKPAGYRPYDRAAGWFRESRERLRERRSTLWGRVAEVPGRGPLLRSRGGSSPEENAK